MHNPPQRQEAFEHLNTLRREIDKLYLDLTWLRQHYPEMSHEERRNAVILAGEIKGFIIQAEAQARHAYAIIAENGFLDAS